MTRKISALRAVVLMASATAALFFATAVSPAHGGCVAVYTDSFLQKVNSMKETLK